MTQLDQSLIYFGKMKRLNMKIACKEMMKKSRLFIIWCEFGYQESIS